MSCNNINELDARVCMLLKEKKKKDCDTNRTVEYLSFSVIFIIMKIFEDILSRSSSQEGIPHQKTKQPLGRIVHKAMITCHSN